MKKILLSIGGSALLLNIICCLIITKYSAVSCVFSSLSILTNTGLIYYLFASKDMRDAFRISISFFICILGLIQFILCVLSPASIENNWYLFGAILILFVDVVLLIVANQISKSFKS